MYISPSYLPNIITSLRLLLTAPIIWSLFARHITLSLSLFAVAAITDWLDGWLARRYAGWTSEWGAFLDPLTDKVLLISTFITCAYLSYLPYWIVIIAVGRDCMIILGILIYHLWIGPIHYQPILSSKINTALQASLILLVFIQQTSWNLSNSFLYINSIAMVIASFISFIQYAEIWISKVWRHVQTHR